MSAGPTPCAWRFGLGLTGCLETFNIRTAPLPPPKIRSAPCHCHFSRSLLYLSFVAVCQATKLSTCQSSRCLSLRTTRWMQIKQVKSHQIFRKFVWKAVAPPPKIRTAPSKNKDCSLWMLPSTNLRCFCLPVRSHVCSLRLCGLCPTESRVHTHTDIFIEIHTHTQSYVYKNIKAHTYMHTSMHVYFTYTYIHAQICTSTHIYHILACSLYFFTLTNRYCCASDSFFVSDRMISRRWLHTQRTNQLHLELTHGLQATSQHLLESTRYVGSSWTGFWHPTPERSPAATCTWCCLLFLFFVLPSC